MIGPEHYMDTERFTIHLNDVFDHVMSYREPWCKLVGKCAVANGCFDGIHPGHLSLLATLDTVTYREGLRPIVAMNSDHSVKMIKGASRPFYPQSVRSAVVNHLKWPLTVVIFDEETPQLLMDLLQPRIVVKGREYTESSVVRWKDSRVVLVDMVPDMSTTKLRGDTR